MAAPTRLETPRLVLRQWEDADYAPFAACNADPEVMRFFPKPLAASESDALARCFRSLIDKRGWGLWAVAAKDGGTFLGFTGLHVPAADLPFAPCVEIGWRLGLHAWGHGYATEAALASLRFGFACLGLDEIVSFTAVGNRRSRAVMERTGMRYGGTFDHPAIPQSHPLKLHCLYRLSRKRWRSVCV